MAGRGDDISEVMERVRVVAIAGLAAESLGWSITPRLCEFARNGLSTFRLDDSVGRLDAVAEVEARSDVALVRIGENPSTPERIDRAFGDLLDEFGDATPVVVVTDGLIAVRSDRVAPRGMVTHASYGDLAPTISDLCGASPDPSLGGRTLLDRAVLFDEWFLDLLGGLAQHSYGERLDMLSHSLQTAANARAAGAEPPLVLAALIHDVGHLLGEPTEWGIPDHATLGASVVQRWFGPGVTEPVRLHVDAKRYMTATDPGYADQLSPASVATLAQQGGPFSEEEAARFRDHPRANEALLLRRADDAGKSPDETPAELEAYRALINSAFEAAAISPEWARDACRCAECRDSHNDQHLIDATDLVGWTTTAATQTPSGWVVDLRHETGDTHRCEIAASVGPTTPSRSMWRADHVEQVRPGAANATEFATRLATYGIALIENRGSEARTVLDFAREIGFVRSTNYGDLFEVIAEDTPSNLAFTSAGLALHTDNPYRDPVPTAQLLHCLHSADRGGGSLFVDGFAVATQFRDSHPEEFELLTTTPVRFEFRDATALLRAEVPLILLDARGQVDRVSINNRSMQAVDAGQRTADFYRAYIAFCELLADSDNTITLTLKPGDLIGFDNRRVLHGRSEYAGGGARHLQGCYIDMDAINSTAARAAR